MSASARLESAVKATVKEINAAAISRAKSGTNIMRNSAITVLGKDGSGRVYRGRAASAPGQPPAPDTGTLRDNWQELPVGISGNGGGVRIVLKIRSDVFYQQFLERGTRKMAARPHMEKILNKSLPKIAELFASI